MLRLIPWIYYTLIPVMAEWFYKVCWGQSLTRLVVGKDTWAKVSEGSAKNRETQEGKARTSRSGPMKNKKFYQSHCTDLRISTAYIVKNIQVSLLGNPHVSIKNVDVFNLTIIMDHHLGNIVTKLKPNGVLFLKYSPKRILNIRSETCAVFVHTP